MVNCNKIKCITKNYTYMRSTNFHYSYQSTNIPYKLHILKCNYNSSSCLPLNSHSRKCDYRIISEESCDTENWSHASKE